MFLAEDLFESREAYYFLLEEQNMKKIISVAIAVVMVFAVLSVNVFAADLFKDSDYDTFITDGGLVASGWVPAVFDYSCGSACADFFAACAEDGAIVEVVTSPNEAGGDLAALCMQTGNWDGVNFYTEKLATTTNEAGQTVTTFDGNAFLDFLTAEGKDYSVIGNVALDIPEGAMIYSIRVYNGEEAPAEEPAPDESTDTDAEEAAPAEDTTPAETGIVLALAPMAIAAAALVVAKKRK